LAAHLSARHRPRRKVVAGQGGTDLIWAIKGGWSRALWRRGPPTKRRRISSQPVYEPVYEPHDRYTSLTTCVDLCMCLTTCVHTRVETSLLQRCSSEENQIEHIASQGGGDRNALAAHLRAGHRPRRERRSRRSRACEHPPRKQNRMCSVCRVGVSLNFHVHPQIISQLLLIFVY